ncbi:MAG TPA: hypothetical protein VF618_02480 [Thermoanaerobaculia bacterium]
MSTTNAVVQAPLAMGFARARASFLRRHRRAASGRGPLLSGRQFIEQLTSAAARKQNSRQMAAAERLHLARRTGIEPVTAATGFMEVQKPSERDLTCVLP